MEAGRLIGGFGLVQHGAQAALWLWDNAQVALVISVGTDLGVNLEITIPILN